MHKACLIHYVNVYDCFTCMSCDPRREQNNHKAILLPDAVKLVIPDPLFHVGDSVIVTYPELKYVKKNRATWSTRMQTEMRGVIIQRPPDGTIVLDNDFERHPSPYMDGDRGNESWEDLPDSGSVWFFPAQARKYFVLLNNGVIDLHHEKGIQKYTSCLPWHCCLRFISGVPSFRIA